VTSMTSADVWPLALTWLCGAAYECACVFWVHFAESCRIGPAVAWSCIAALVTVVGLGEAIHRPVYIAAYVAGYGCGTALAIVWKTRAPVSAKDNGSQPKGRR
jgi:hypothetical protein